VRLSANGLNEWLAIDDAGAVTRSPGAEPPKGITVAAPSRIGAVVPGEDVSVHWVELPTGLTDAQAQAAGRLMAGDLSAEDGEKLHIAVGPEKEGTR